MDLTGSILLHEFSNCLPALVRGATTCLTSITTGLNRQKYDFYKVKQTQISLFWELHLRSKWSAVELTYFPL